MFLNRFWKRLQDPREHRWRKLDQCNPSQQRAHLLGMRARKLERVNAGPDFIFKESAGDQELVPDFRGRLAVFREKMSERDRGIEINQRSLRSCSSARSSLRKDISGLRGGGPAPGRAGGVIQPWRTASASKASASTGLRLFSGGTSSATTRSRSVTRMVSPRSARRTYSLSLFLRTFIPTALIEESVASGSYQCQGTKGLGKIGSIADLSPGDFAWI